LKNQVFWADFLDKAIDLGLTDFYPSLDSQVSQPYR